MNFLKKFFIFLFIILLIGFIFIKYQVRDRHPDYRLFQNISTKKQGSISTGFAAVQIIMQSMNLKKATRIMMITAMESLMLFGLPVFIIVVQQTEFMIRCGPELLFLMTALRALQ